MSLETRLSDLVAAVAARIKPLQLAQGSLAALTTTEKTSLVGAINELHAAIGGAGGAGIDDAAGAGDTDSTWSASKILTELAAIRTSILGGVDPAWDTLQELVAELGNQDGAISSLLAAVGNRVRYDAAQVLTAPQQAQACANIGLGNTEADLAALFEAQFA